MLELWPGSGLQVIATLENCGQGHMVAAANSTVTVGSSLEKKYGVGEPQPRLRARSGPGEAAKAKTKDVKNERTNPLCPLESTKVPKNEPKRTPNEPI